MEASSLALSTRDPLDSLIDVAAKKPKSRRTQILDLSEPFSELSRKDELVVWASLQRRAQAAVQECRSAPKGSEDADSAVARAAELARCGFALARHAVAADDKGMGQPQTFYDSLLALRDAACEAAERGVAGVAREALLEGSELAYCWWSSRKRHYEAVVPELVPLVARRLALRPLSAPDVKKAYAMRAAFTLACADPLSPVPLRGLLARVAASGELAKKAEGPRLVAHLLVCRAEVASDAHAAVLAALPHAAPAAAEGHSRATLRAWRAARAAAEGGKDASAGAVLAALEESVQDTMRRALFARTPALAAALRRLLSAFHRSAGSPEVAALLWRLYEPLLWRHLTAANPAVRRNAAALLLEAFPLLPPGAGEEGQRAELKRQFAGLEAALEDGDVRVRLAATEGAGRLLARLHEPALAAFLARRAAFDAASPAVRAAALAALAPLLDDPVAHATLAEVLPELRPLLDDRSEAVRAAFVRLLLALAAGPPGFALRPRDVAPPSALLPRLAADDALARACPPGARRAALEAAADGIAELLAPVFLPPAKDAPDLMKRFVALAQHCPEAAPALYSRLLAPRASGRGGPVALPRLVPLLRLFVGLAAASLTRRHSRATKTTRRAAAAGGRKRAPEGADAEGEKEQRQEAEEAEEARVADAALESLAAAWAAAGPLLRQPEHAHLATAMCGWLSGGLLDALLASYALPNPDLPAAFRRPSPATRAALIRLAAAAGPEAAPAAAAGLAEALAGAALARDGAAVEGLLEVAAAWGQTGPALELLAAATRDILADAPDADDDEAAGKRKRAAAVKGRQRARQQQQQQARAAEGEAAPPLLPGVEGEGEAGVRALTALAILERALEKESWRTALAASPSGPAIVAALGRSAALLARRLRDGGPAAAAGDGLGSEALLRALSAHARLACALHAGPAPAKGRKRAAAAAGRRPWPEPLAVLVEWALQTPGLFPGEGAESPATPSGSSPPLVRARRREDGSDGSEDGAGGESPRGGPGAPPAPLAERVAEVVLSALADAAALFARPEPATRGRLWALLRRAGLSPSIPAPSTAAAASRLLCAAAAACEREGADGPDEALQPAISLAAALLRRCGPCDEALARALRPALSCALSRAAGAGPSPAERAAALAPVVHAAAEACARRAAPEDGGAPCTPLGPVRHQRRVGEDGAELEAAAGEKKGAPRPEKNGPGGPVVAALVACLARAPAAACAAVVHALAVSLAPSQPAHAVASRAALLAELAAAVGKPHDGPLAAALREARSRSAACCSPPAPSAAEAPPPCTRAA